MANEIPYAELEFNSVDQMPNLDFNNPQDVVQENVEIGFKVTGLNQEGSQLTLSDTFARLASILQRNLIVDFSLTRTNLEQVFINFAKFQIQAAADGQRQNNRAV